MVCHPVIVRLVQQVNRRRVHVVVIPVSIRATDVNRYAGMRVYRLALSEVITVYRIVISICTNEQSRDASSGYIKGAGGPLKLYRSN